MLSGSICFLGSFDCFSDSASEEETGDLQLSMSELVSCPCMTLSCTSFTLTDAVSTEFYILSRGCTCTSSASPTAGSSHTQSTGSCCSSCTTPGPAPSASASCSSATTLSAGGGSCSSSRSRTTPAQLTLPPPQSLHQK